MSERSVDSCPRWLDPASGTSSELRSALETLRVTDSTDVARIARLELRLGGLLDSVPQPDLPSHGSAPSAGSGLSVAKVCALVATGVGLTVAGSVALLGDKPSSSTTAAPTTPQPTESAATIASARVAPVASHPQPVPAGSSSPTSVVPKKSRHAPSAAGSAAVEDSIAEEARLLRAARGAIDSSPDRALALLAEHAQKFPQSTLADERQLFTIQALVQAGRMLEANEQFEHLRPDSPYRGRAARAVSRE